MYDGEKVGEIFVLYDGEKGGQNVGSLALCPLILIWLFLLTYIGPQLRLDFTIVIVMTALYIKPRTPRSLMSTLVLSYLWATSDFLPALWATGGLGFVSVIYIYIERNIYIYVHTYNISIVFIIIADCK